MDAVTYCTDCGAAMLHRPGCTMPDEHDVVGFVVVERGYKEDGELLLIVDSMMYPSRDYAVEVADEIRDGINPPVAVAEVRLTEAYR